ncbi:hypothetical protein EHR03_00490 [Leptospira mayottensis]|nr:hypothetical protein EHR03_00490 [Leptospira mayottensis]
MGKGKIFVCPWEFLPVLCFIEYIKIFIYSIFLIYIYEVLKLGVCSFGVQYNCSLFPIKDTFDEHLTNLYIIECLKFHA